MIEGLLALLPILLPLTCVILIAILYAILLKKKFLETLFLSVSTIILVLFLCGILNFKGCLLVGYGIIIILSIIALFVFLRAFILDRKILKNISLLSGLLVIGFFFAFSLYLNYRRMFTNWDEFSHWGVVVKSMYTYDALGTFKDALIMFKAYLPGTSLFQYFWTRPFPTFTEFPTLIASNMIFFSIITTFIKKLNFRNILFVATSLLIPFLMGTFFYISLYVDCLLGILFASTLLFYYYYRYEMSTHGIIMVVASVTLLTLIKDMGFVFAGIAILIMIADSVIFRRKKLQEYINQGKSVASKIKKLFILASPLISAIFIELLWRIHIYQANITSPWLHSSNISLHGIDLLPYQEQTIELFKNALINKPIYPLEYSWVIILIATAILFIILCLTVKKRDIKLQRLIFAIIGIIAGAILYTGILFVFYVFLMTEYEALILAGYERYIFSYAIGIFFFFLIFIALKPKRANHSAKRKIPYYFIKAISIIVICSMYYLLIRNTAKYIKSDWLEARESAHLSMENWETYNQSLKWGKYLRDPAYKPYLITQDDYGLMKLKLIYTLFPTNIQWIWDYSVALEPYFPEMNDPWTKIITAKEWGKYVTDNYNLVYVFVYDKKFSDTYGHFFDTLQNNNLYEVNTDNSGNLKLISVTEE